MATLKLSFHGNTLDEIDLVKDYTTIGRKAENDIPIDNLTVSGHHARVIKVLNDYFLEDLDSTNGVLINGRPVKRHTLHDGVIFTIGNHQLQFTNADQQEGAGDLEKTIATRPAPLVEQVDDEPAARTATAASETVREPSAVEQTAYLQILSGPDTGRILELTKEISKIGRKGVQVVAITRRDGRHYLVCIEGGAGSDRYPLVNDLPTGSQAFLLHDQDVIEMAGVKMGFFAAV